jgi:hypothetical protein
MDIYIINYFIFYHIKSRKNMDSEEVKIDETKLKEEVDKLLDAFNNSTMFSSHLVDTLKDNYRYNISNKKEAFKMQFRYVAKMVVKNYNEFINGKYGMYNKFLDDSPTINKYFTEATAPTGVSYTHLTLPTSP